MSRSRPSAAGEADIHRLTFESAISPEGDGKAHKALEADKRKLAEVEGQIAPLQKQMDQLSRQFWVTKEQVKANNYDLSASRYRQGERDEAYYESPQVTMERLLELERVMAHEVRELKGLIE